MSELKLQLTQVSSAYENLQRELTCCVSEVTATIDNAKSCNRPNDACGRNCVARGCYSSQPFSCLNCIRTTVAVGSVLLT